MKRLPNVNQRLPNPYAKAKVGDYLLFPSGLKRRIVGVSKGRNDDPGHYIQLVQLKDGVIGNYRKGWPTRQGVHWRRKTRADGKRRTTFLYYDLRTMGAVLCPS